MKFLTKSSVINLQQLFQLDVKYQKLSQQDCTRADTISVAIRETAQVIYRLLNKHKRFSEKL